VSLLQVSEKGLEGDRRSEELAPVGRGIVGGHHVMITRGERLAGKSLRKKLRKEWAKREAPGTVKVRLKRETRKVEIPKGRRRPGN